MTFIFEIGLKILIFIYFSSIEIDIIYGAPGGNPWNNHQHYGVGNVGYDQITEPEQTQDYEMFQYLLRNPPEIGNYQTSTSLQHGNIQESQGTSYVSPHEGDHDNSLSGWNDFSAKRDYNQYLQYHQHLNEGLASSKYGTNIHPNAREYADSRNIGSDQNPSRNPPEIGQEDLKYKSKTSPFRSPIWDYYTIFFNVDGVRCVQCNNCSQQYIFEPGSTSANFRGHLESTHKEQFNEYLDKAKRNKQEYEGYTFSKILLNLIEIALIHLTFLFLSCTQI
uniref:BED-type domain-containing protein n=1 Tax=Meloidogyne javanica TaxID=6303 RepID=A0A915N1J4_MELJA